VLKQTLGLNLERSTGSSDIPQLSDPSLVSDKDEIVHVGFV
jgi:hypothetical protein